MDDTYMDMNKDHEPVLPIESNDDVVLRALGGASFGPEAEVVLPSGATLDGSEAGVFSGMMSRRGSDWDRDKYREMIKRERKEAALGRFYQECGDGGTVEEKYIAYVQYVESKIASKRYPTHFYDYPFANAASMFFIPRNKKPSVLPSGLYGADSIHVLQGDGMGKVLNPLDGDLGHSSIGEVKNGDVPWLPMFRDVLDNIIKSPSFSEGKKFTLTKKYVEDKIDSLLSSFSRDNKDIYGINKEIAASAAARIDYMLASLQIRRLYLEHKQTEDGRREERFGNNNEESGALADAPHTTIANITSIAPASARWIVFGDNNSVRVGASGRFKSDEYKPSQDKSTNILGDFESATPKDRVGIFKAYAETLSARLREGKIIEDEINTFKQVLQFIKPSVF